jgi:hypothetical protein
LPKLEAWLGTQPEKEGAGDVRIGNGREDPANQPKIKANRHPVRKYAIESIRRRRGGRRTKKIFELESKRSCMIVELSLNCVLINLS